MHKNHVFFVVMFLFFFIRLLDSSIFSESQIMTDKGLTYIGELNLQSTVLGLNCEAQTIKEVMAKTSISEIKEEKVDILIQIQTPTGVILSPQDQYFYDLFLNDWIAAQHLTSENVFLTHDLQALQVVDVQKVYAPDSCVRNITLARYYTFFISDGSSLVLVHNFPAVVLGPSAIKVSQLLIGTAVVAGGSYALSKLCALFSKKNLENENKSSDGNEKARLRKSKDPYERLIREHKQKLKDYKKNPDDYDNKSILKQVSNDQRQKIINGRINALKRQIQKQQGELDKINEQLYKIRGN